MNGNSEQALTASLWDKRPWILVIILTASYPYLLKLFAWSIYCYNNAENIIEQITMSSLAVLSILIALSIPVTSIWAQTKLKNSTKSNVSSLRTVLFMIVTVPPFYILSLQFVQLIGLQNWHTSLWVSSIILIGAILIPNYGHTTKHHKSNLNYKTIRKIHGISALLLIFGFISLHLTNHIFALHSNAMYEEIRLIFNSWYQSDLVEPILLALLGIMILTGVPMIRRYIGTDSDIFRILQISSGLYIAVFLCAHVKAVLNARNNGVETDWIFATGLDGLINGYYILIPYYTLSVIMMILHASLGFRMVLLSRKASLKRANHIFYRIIILGSLFSILILAAILGIQI
jgi:hypothetical protein